MEQSQLCTITQRYVSTPLEGRTESVMMSDQIVGRSKRINGELYFASSLVGSELLFALADFRYKYIEHERAQLLFIIALSILYRSTAPSLTSVELL